RGVLYGDDTPPANGCTVIRAMFNTAATIRQSLTVIETSDPPLPAASSSLVTWIFKQIGEVVFLPSSNMDASTALCGSGPAFFLLMVEAAADGGVAMGLPRAEAQKMAAQSMMGAAGMVLSGQHPAVLKDKVCTPGGCTIGGLMVLEEGGVRGCVGRAVREATVVASQLGQGAKLVNGTRH
ncbi:pyrroline-5-carboxylate reductase, partial [Candidatus Bathyarchaeota archaeon]|nr:pyrroline-5-carboxylate reductase [Candidatus Bathyarchaeota archaeon]